MYLSKQITDMIQIYGKADENRQKAKKIYAQRFISCKISNKKIF